MIKWEIEDSPNPERLDAIAVKFCDPDNAISMGEMHELACLALAELQRLRAMVCGAGVIECHGDHETTGGRIFNCSTAKRCYKAYRNFRTNADGFNDWDEHREFDDPVAAWRWLNSE